MLVKEMIAMLEDLPPDDEIKIAIPTHCHWGRRIAVDFGEPKQETVQHSDCYHELCIEDEDKCDDDGVQLPQVWTIPIESSW